MENYPYFYVLEAWNEALLGTIGGMDLKASFEVSLVVALRGGTAGKFC